jgi:hypothetical protein
MLTAQSKIDATRRTDSSVQKNLCSRADWLIKKSIEVVLLHKLHRMRKRHHHPNEWLKPKFASVLGMDADHNTDKSVTTLLVEYIPVAGWLTGGHQPGRSQLPFGAESARQKYPGTD